MIHNPFTKKIRIVLEYDPVTSSLNLEPVKINPISLADILVMAASGVLKEFAKMQSMIVGANNQPIMPETGSETKNDA